MLHNALGESVSYMTPTLPKVLASVTKTLIPFAQPQICTPVYSLFTDVGPVSTPDLALASCLSQLQLTYTTQTSTSVDPTSSNKSSDLLRLFPVACACMFASEKWESAAYNYDLEAFERNEHTSMIAAAALSVAFFVGDAANPNNQDLSSVAPGPLTTVRVMCDTFLRVCSQLLLTLRSAETTTYTSRPLRSMCTLMETFVNSCPRNVITPADLEKYFPYSLLHSCLMDVSLGKHKETDHLKTFTQSEHGSSSPYGNTPRDSREFNLNTADSAV
jgi:hypothetical protein